MEIKDELKNGVIVIYLSGDIDREAEEKLEDYFKNILQNDKKKVVLNLSGLDYINSSILGIFVKFYKNLKRLKGDMCFSNVKPFVLNMLKITHINDIIKIYTLEKDAIRDLL